MTEFSVGQKVTIVSGYGQRITGITTVASIGKVKIKTSDKQEWKARNGDGWGASGPWYSGPSIRKWRESDDEELRRNRAVSRIKNFDGWGIVSTDDLETVAEIIRRRDREIDAKIAEAKS